MVERSFNPTDKFENAFIERREMEYLYNDGELYYFMDTETYEQMPLNADKLSDAFKFVKENTIVKVLSYKGNVFGLEPPMFVDLVVTETDPGFRGDTATNVTKPAILECGGGTDAPAPARRRRARRASCRDFHTQCAGRRPPWCRRG